MTRHPRSITTVTAAGCLLLAACSSSASSPAARPNPSVGQSPILGNAAASSAGPASAGSTAAGGTAPAAPGHNAQACSLVTQQDASTALGAAVGPGQARTQGAGSSCNYGAGGLSSISVSLALVGGKAAFDRERSRTASARPGTVFDVTGVGDGAIGTSNGPVAAIEFYKGDTAVSIILTIGGATATPKDQVIVLARTAASRL